MIKINSEGYNRTVTLGALCVGDTFLMEGKVCMIALCNGLPFVVELATGKDYGSINPASSFRRVVPIECELSYKIK